MPEVKAIEKLKDCDREGEVKSVEHAVGNQFHVAAQASVTYFTLQKDAVPFAKKHVA